MNQLNRRDMLLHGGAGFGAVALSYLLRNDRLMADLAASSSSRIAQLLPRAKSVIFLFMEGGPSHIDSFDPKPKLNELAGQPLPPGFKRVITAMGEIDSPLLESKRKWAQHGECGTWVSDWLPYTAACVDDIAVIRSCWTNGINHSGGVCQMNTGTPLAGRPCLGSWVSYGLGTENQNLPSFVVMTDRSSLPVNGVRNWSAGFMPAAYQGVKLEIGEEPIRYLNTPESVSPERQLAKLELLDAMNREHAQTRKFQSELDARIRSYELAFRMQAHAPDAVDLAEETQQTQDLYGINDTDVGDEGRAFAATACWRGGSSSAASCSSTPVRGASGTRTAASRRITRRCSARPTSPRRRCSATSSSAGYWTRRSSSGAASSAARR